MTKGATRARPRRHEVPAFLRDGLRPFFLGAAVWVCVDLAWWLASYEGGFNPPSAFDARGWHIHEMVFGYGGAVVAGFLLTALPNWTGRPAVRGMPLAALFVLWALARVAVLTSDGVWGPWPAVVLDVGFLVVLAVIVVVAIVGGGNLRDSPVAVAVALLAAGAGLSHAGDVFHVVGQDWGWRLGIAALLGLIALIGGRIVPAFTRNWLVRRGSRDLPAAFGALDKGVLVLTALALAAWVADLGPSAGAVLVVTGLGHAVRLGRWCGWRTLAEPLVAVLHLGYAWLAVGLLLLGLARLGIIVEAAAVHALTAGAIGTMTMAVMTRASLGHTGHALSAGPGTVAIYALVTIGAVVRVAAPWLPLDYALALSLAALTWGGGFALFVALYAPLLMRSQLTDVKEGGARAA